MLRMVMFQGEDEWSRLGMDYTSTSCERLLKNPSLQKNILARNLAFFLVHVSRTYETRCIHCKYTNMSPDLNKALNYTVVKELLHC